VSSTRVFIVDDEPVIASSLAAILQMNGFSARFFTCPLEALAAARSESPDLVISDVAMPGERYANHRSGRVYGASVRVDCRSFH
jgi:CheY-like chemotaxis protein